MGGKSAKENFVDPTTPGFGLEEVGRSADQLALVWNAQGEVVAASPVPGATPGSFEVDVTRYRTDRDLGASVSLRRTRELGLPPLSSATNYLTTSNEFSERTRILALDSETLELRDDDLLEWLIAAENEMIVGTDMHPVFETSLEETACSIQRLPNGQVTMTEVPRSHVNELRNKVRSSTGRAGTGMQLSIEPPLRAMARYFLAATPDGEETMRPVRGTEVTAFLIVTSAGYSFGLWSPKSGLFSEYAFLSPRSISQGPRTQEKDAQDLGTGGISFRTDDDSDAAAAYLKQVFEQLLLQMSNDKLDGLGLAAYSQLIWASEAGLMEATGTAASEYASKTPMRFIALNVPADEAVAGGLLLGSYAFGDRTVAGAEVLAPINLAHDLLAAADTGEIERHREEEAKLDRRRARAVMTVMAAPVIVAALLLAIMTNLIASSFMTAWREASADARTAELKPALERRKSYEANLKWYQEFISEVSQLRKQQPVGIGLMYQLNSNYPLTIDPAFYVSDMKITPIGEVEIKGLARSKDAVASFLKSLEFASGGDNGARLFSGLAYEVQEVGSATATQVKLPTATGSTPPSSTAAGPGVVSWSIRGNYLPVAALAPKPAVAEKPGVPAAAAPAVVAPKAG